MVFVDEVRIFVKAGDGGKGCESYQSDKFTRHPKPDGGDGAKGGDIVVTANRNIQTLLDFRYQQHYKAKKGGHGGSKGKKGKAGADSILQVPVGTVVWDHTTGLLIRDLIVEGQNIIVAKGGEGGRGNMHKKTPAPPGTGEEKTIRLELKIIADVGIVGFPNAGKSTLVSSISKVKSPVANYPFTTKRPILGIVEDEDFNFVVADLPGLIEGAHTGKGLGHRFLKHAERTKILLHVIDFSGQEGRDPLDDYEKINHELQAYSDRLSSKHKVVVANKMDVKEAQKNLKRFKTKYDLKIFPISALKNDGLDVLVKAIGEILCPESFQDRSNA